MTAAFYLFCSMCDSTVRFLFVQDDGIYEVYECEHCKNKVRYAVR